MILRCRQEFFDTIARAKQRIEAFSEECLFDAKVPTNGVKFSLANNQGWKDKTEQTVKIEKDGAAALAAKLFAEDDEETNDGDVE